MTLRWSVGIVLALGSLGCAESTSAGAAVILEPEIARRFWELDARIHEHGEEAVLGSPELRAALARELDQLAPAFEAARRRSAELRNLAASERAAVARYPSVVRLLESWTAPTLFGLETGGHQLWHRTGPEGRRYTVMAKDGSVAAEWIDERQLVRDFPALHGLMRLTQDAIGPGGPLLAPPDDHDER